MADVLTTSVNLSDFVQGSFDRLLYFALRSQPVFRMVADVKPVYQTAPGSSVTFSFQNNLATVTSTLDESTDVDRVALGETQVSVSVGEHGSAVGTTAKLRATSLMDVEAGAIDVITFNLIDSLDEVVRDVLVAGDNVDFSGSATVRGEVTPADTFATADTRLVVSRLRKRSAPPKRGGYYVAFIHPDVSHDQRAEAGSNANWNEAHVYASPDAIYAGEIGAYQGAIFIETPRAPIHTDEGSSPATTDVYSTIFCGQQALAEAVAIEPHVVQSPVVDRLRRFASYGWYSLIGWGRFREASLHRVESASTIEE